MRRLVSGLALAFLAIFILLALNYRVVLQSIGYFLVKDEAPVKSDIAIVLAGDFSGRRILRAGELVRAGFAPVTLVSGPIPIYGVNEATLAIQYARTTGFPPEYFQPFFLSALSTLDESHSFGAELRKRKLRSVLLVTSNFHTRRAAEMFRAALGSDIRLTVVAAQDEDFDPKTWWQSRQGQKVVFFEMSKTIAGWIGL